METTESQAFPFDPFCLGMCSWTCCPGNADVETPEPHLPTSTSKPHLSTPSESQPLLPHPSSVSLPLQPHPSSASGRFKRVTDQELSKLAEGLVPQNTAKMTSWAQKNFQKWMSNSNVCNPSDPVPEDFLQCTDPVTLNKHLSKFIVETRKSSGELYPPVTLHQLLCGILRYMRRKKIPGSNVFMGHLTPTSTSCTQTESEDRYSSLK